MENGKRTEIFYTFDGVLMISKKDYQIMEENDISISKRIKHWRKEKGLTQDALSKLADIPYTTLAKIESDVVKHPSIKTIIKIAKGLGITIDELINE